MTTMTRFVPWTRSMRRQPGPSQAIGYAALRPGERSAAPTRRDVRRRGQPYVASLFDQLLDLSVLEEAVMFHGERVQWCEPVRIGVGRLSQGRPRLRERLRRGAEEKLFLDLSHDGGVLVEETVDLAATHVRDFGDRVAVRLCRQCLPDGDVACPDEEPVEDRYAPGGG